MIYVYIYIYIYIRTLWTFCVPVWICPFHVFISGYGTMWEAGIKGRYLKSHNKPINKVLQEAKGDKTRAPKNKCIWILQFNCWSNVAWNCHATNELSVIVGFYRRFHIPYSLCKDYCQKKRKQRSEFQFWMRLIPFHIIVILLRKAWINLFPPAMGK